VRSWECDRNHYSQSRNEDYPNVF